MAAVSALALVLCAVWAGPSAGETAQTSAVKTVDIRNFAFHPSGLTVSKGATVKFVNSSGVTHTASRAKSFDTGNIAAGKSASVTFKQTGTFAYHCKIHPFMKGTVVVK